MKESEAKIKELQGKNNADLEATNAKLKDTILKYDSQLHGESHVEASSHFDAVHQQTAATDARVKEMQKKISTLKSRCLTMESLKDNDKVVKFYTGLPNYDTLRVIFELASSVSYELTAYKQFLQLICLCKPLIKPLT